MTRPKQGRKHLKKAQSSAEATSTLKIEGTGPYGSSASQRKLPRHTMAAITSRSKAEAKAKGRLERLSQNSHEA